MDEASAIKISIAMTTYNGARYLPVQLQSFAEQTRLPDELIVCDDRSTDDTIAILTAFSVAVSFEVRIVRNAENLGHERNFSQAVDLCTGDIIVLADQDDAWFPEKLAQVEAEFRGRDDALLVVNDVMITDRELKPTGRTLIEQQRASGLLGEGGKGLTLGCATSFRSSLRVLLSPIPALDIGHDTWVHDFTNLIGGRRVIPRALQLYRRHGENASAWAFDGPKRATALTIMRPSAGQDLSGQYEKRIAALRLMRDRLEALGPTCFAALGSKRRFKDVAADIDDALAAVELRTAIFRKNWLGRKVLAVRLLASGGYRHFLGWRSFLKDLIR